MNQHRLSRNTEFEVCLHASLYFIQILQRPLEDSMMYVCSAGNQSQPLRILHMSSTMAPFWPGTLNANPNITILSPEMMVLSVRGRNFILQVLLVYSVESWDIGGHEVKTIFKFNFIIVGGVCGTHVEVRWQLWSHGPSTLSWIQAARLEHQAPRPIELSS